MKEFIGKKVIATCECWFYPGDGYQYRTVWGTLHAINKIDENTLGFTPNRPNVNWIYKIGDMFIHGCQIKYIILREEKPDMTGQEAWEVHQGELKTFRTPNLIYITT